MGRERDGELRSGALYAVSTPLQVGLYGTEPARAGVIAMLGLAGAL
ncbi:MAG TPA: hypothetical protein VMF89_07690 [Polyangiales bacterium]|nr:hypothetical protein [Polyangiales bacterium]